MGPAFWWGFIAGCALFLLFGMVERRLYRGILLESVENGTPVKIDEGHFFIVRESDYVGMKMYSARAALEAERGKDWHDFRDYPGGRRDWTASRDFDRSPMSGVAMRRDET